MLHHNVQLIEVAWLPMRLPCADRQKPERHVKREHVSRRSRYKAGTTGRFKLVVIGVTIIKLRTHLQPLRGVSKNSRYSF